MNWILPRILILFLFVFSSCADKEPEPQFNIQGIKTTISRILVSPLAHDGARVVVLGYIKNIESVKTNSESKLITLSDIKDNSIEVEFNSGLDAKTGEQVLAGGVYRKDLNRITDAEIYKFVVEDNIIKPLDN